MAKHPSDSLQKAPRDRSQKDGKQPAKQHTPPSVAIRETVESVVIAFVLAFLFRTFVAEAFVIPTGSMATTLMGRHKDVVCDACGYPFQVNASGEVNPDGSPRTDESDGRPGQIVRCMCPLCRFTMDIGPGNPQKKSYPSYTGDRILVGKFAYDISDPKRWDVAVFKYPGDAQTNYIKRLVGLPHETVRIQRGDVFVKPEGSDEFQMARKPADKMLAMLRPVFDNDFMPAIAKYGWPARWQPVGGNGFKALEDQKSFESDPAAASASIYYFHLTPTWNDWQETLRAGDGGKGKPARVLPQLITDFLGYNTDRDRGASRHSAGPDTENLGLHWVGDLAMQCDVDVRSDAGSLIFELVKGGRQFQCRVNVADGMAEMAIVGDDMREFRPAGKTPLAGRGKHKVLFSNVDSQLRLFVDGNLVELGGGDQATCYGELGNICPDQRDLAPAAIATENAAVRVSDLKLMRDIYYIAHSTVVPGPSRGTVSERPEATKQGFFSDPRLWPEAYASPLNVDFPLAADQFLALGDNSAKSRDSRFWGTSPNFSGEPIEYYVSRDLLTGKAFFIYWPHSWNWPVPFFPNFSRMGFVR